MVSSRVIFVALSQLFLDKVHGGFHSLRRFIETKMPSLRELNQNTFFSVAEIPDAMDSESAAWLIYGDSTSNLSIPFSDMFFH